MDPLLSGLIGALIGGGATVLAVWIQASSQAKRERIRIVTEIAMADYKYAVELARDAGKYGKIPPATLYFHYHLELAKLMESGTITSSGLEKLTRENREIYQVIQDLHDERNAG
jgi:hypothetical protein